MMCYKLSRNWTVSRTLIISWFLSVTPEQVKRTSTVNEISETVLVKGVLIVPWITLQLWSCDALFHSALLLTLTVIIYWLQVTDESELQKVNVKSGATQWLSGAQAPIWNYPMLPTDNTCSVFITCFILLLIKISLQRAFTQSPGSAANLPTL